MAVDIILLVEETTDLGQVTDKPTGYIVTTNSKYIRFYYAQSGDGTHTIEVHDVIDCHDIK